LSERDGYQPGVPCWVDSWQPDAEAAVAFYTKLFGWEPEEAAPASSGRRHFMCRLRGRDVAGIGSPPPDGAPPAWGTYVWVESADAAAASARDAGGGVVVEPFESLDGGRMAILSDPAGAVLGVWQPGNHKGAQLVNEPGAWSMSQLNTSDPEGAKAFYGAVFGWKTDAFDMGFGEITMWRVPGYEGGEPGQPVSREVVATMAPLTSDVPDGTPPHWSIDFWVHDVDATAASAVELGGKVVASPFDTPVGRTGVIADPQGAAFSVSKVGPA
jgi:predicted enzyme related to lactoylglutathione lyase